MGSWKRVPLFWWNHLQYHYHHNHLQVLPKLRSDLSHCHSIPNCLYQMHPKLGQLNFLQPRQYYFHYHFHLKVALTQLGDCLHKKCHLPLLLTTHHKIPYLQRTIIFLVCLLFSFKLYMTYTKSFIFFLCKRFLLFVWTYK